MATSSITGTSSMPCAASQWPCMGHDHDSFRDQIRADHKKRREFLLAVLKEEEPLEVHEGFSFLSVCFLQSEDLEWLLSISPRGAAPIAGINEQSLCAWIQ